MDTATALRMLPAQMHDTFKSDVYWWINYYVDPDTPEGELPAPNPEQWAVEMAFRNMRGEDVRYRFVAVRDETAELGYRMRGDHWCRGWYYCFRCYGN